MPSDQATTPGTPNPASTKPITLPFATLDVFTSTRFTGNPLGLVILPPEHHALPQAAKQRVAREFNLSETVFLHVPSATNPDPSDSEGKIHTRCPAELRLDIFTCEQELPFAGHPTIGTASYLLQHQEPGSVLGGVTSLLTKAGSISISASNSTPESTTGGVQAAIPHDVHLHSRTLASLLSSDEASSAVVSAGLSGDAEVRAAELAAPLVSVVRGMTFALARLRGPEALGRVGATGPRLDFAALPTLLDEGPWGAEAAGGFVARYYYCVVGRGDGAPTVADGGGGPTTTVRLRARMVELGMEDPATGSAASALACHLAVSGEVGEAAGERILFEVKQGVEMGRRSSISVEVVRARTDEAGWEVKELYLGGTAVVVMKGTITV